MEPNRKRQRRYTNFLNISDKFGETERAEYRRRYPEEDEAMTGYFQQIREQADTDTLLEWSERILAAKTIDDVIH